MKRFVLTVLIMLLALGAIQPCNAACLRPHKQTDHACCAQMGHEFSAECCAHRPPAEPSLPQTQPAASPAAVCLHAAIVPIALAAHVGAFTAHPAYAPVPIPILRI